MNLEFISYVFLTLLGDFWAGYFFDRLDKILLSSNYSKSARVNYLKLVNLIVSRPPKP